MAGGRAGGGRAVIDLPGVGDAAGDGDVVRGLDAGADYYLTKSSFHDESLLQAVADLIGEAEG